MRTTDFNEPIFKQFFVLDSGVSPIAISFWICTGTTEKPLDRDEIGKLIPQGLKHVCLHV